MTTEIAKLDDLAQQALRDHYAALDAGDTERAAHLRKLVDMLVNKQSQILSEREKRRYERT